MPRKKRYRPNWPYRLAWLIIVGTIVGYIVFGTLFSGIGTHRNPFLRDWSIAFVSKSLDAIFATWFVVVGASIGSFLNVVAYRLPLERTLGGHSACPFCCTRILGVDNVPVLAWLRLRGRCRACHLPISPQYPLVELGVALVFLFVYLTEFSVAGDNLPGTASGKHGFGVVWTNTNLQIVLRTLIHLFVVSGLIGAALIAIQRRTVPVKLYAWLLAIPAALEILMPGLMVVPWWKGSRSLSGPDLHLDAIVTILCGLVAGVAIARVLAPLIYGEIDRKLLSSDKATAGARQWMGALGVAGAFVGWQAAILMAWIALGCQLVGVLVLRATSTKLNLADSTAWVWCGLLFMRANWKWSTSFELPAAGSITVYGYVLAIALLAPVCWSIRVCGPLHAETKADDTSNDVDDYSESVDIPFGEPIAADDTIQNDTCPHDFNGKQGN